MYLFNGLAVLTYLHLDCIDGKQARRTGSSSPLGQLFDHGAASPHAIGSPFLKSYVHYGKISIKYQKHEISLGDAVLPLKTASKA